MAQANAKIDHVSLRTFAHATEDPAKVERALLFAAGAPEAAVGLAGASNGGASAGSPEARAVAALKKGLVTVRGKGHAGNPIRILEVTLSANRLLNAFLERLRETSIPQHLRVEADARLDEDLVLYARFDKQEAYQGRLELSTGEDVIHVRLKVATFPKRRETALAYLREILAP